MTLQERSKDKRLRRTYGISWYEYCRILKFQKGVCAICRRPPGRYLLSVDHRHILQDKKHQGIEARARVRGLLCWNCNKALAKFRDNPKLLRSAADYLEQPPAQRILKEKRNE